MQPSLPTLACHYAQIRHCMVPDGGGGRGMGKAEVYCIAAFFVWEMTAI